MMGEYGAIRHQAWWQMAGLRKIGNVGEYGCAYLSSSFTTGLSCRHSHNALAILSHYGNISQLGRLFKLMSVAWRPPDPCCCGVESFRLEVNEGRGIV